MNRKAVAERKFTSWDGVELFYRYWPPVTDTGQAVVIFHRGHEHSGRMAELVETLDLKNTAFFAWDARGHGRSPGERGHAESFSVLVKDADCFVRHVGEECGIAIRDIIVIGVSVGGVLAAAWVHDYAPPIRAMVLAAPAFRINLYVPLAMPLLRILQKFRKKSFIHSYVKSNMLTHDKEEMAKYDTDPLISRAIAVNILTDLEEVSTRLLRDAGAIVAPTLVLSAGSDWVVRNSAQQEFVERLSSSDKRLITYPGFYHAIFHEKKRQQPIADTREFVMKHFESPNAAPSLLNADRVGYTRDEYISLVTPLPILSVKNLTYGLTRLSMRTLGKASRGIALGGKTGFDSGESLDYVYRNTPQGFTPVGRWLDKVYLESIGWRGIRQRKVNLKAALARVIGNLSEEGRPIRILDVASGPGRYILETIREMSDIEIQALLRDWSEAGLEAGRNLVKEMKLNNVIHERGDAFDPVSLAAIKPSPTIAIVSGLYELFPDNERVRRSLSGLYDAMIDGGYLIYTCQPYHPQVEMIARTLVNRDGKPWIMRRRTQLEMDQLVAAAGFERIGIEIDQWGIFTVSVARRKARR